MDELINDFIAETRDMLQAVGEEIVAWEANPTDRARLDEIFRFVHTVKGNCGFFDLPRLEALSHAAEDALSDVRAGKRSADAPLVNAVLAIIDRIGELVQALETGEAVASADDGLLIEALKPGAGPVQEIAEPQAVAGEARKGQRSIRLSVDLLDHMMSGVSDAVLARNELSRRLREADSDPVVEAAFERLSACIAEIRDAITRTRMQRIDGLFAALPRAVRDVSAELAKKVKLEIDGGDVELDREMIEMIRDPLTHMVRNAIDHGIEAPADRLASGKPESGTLKVCARQSGNQILIEVADDGRGIDGNALVRKALAAGVVTAERAERMTTAQKIALIFEAGLSTAREITAISGRGVGMDVVRANVERIGGLVEVDSRLGQGVRFTIRVPLTLTIIPALTVSSGGQVFAIPRAAIEEILRGSSASVRLERLGDSRVATIRGRRMPLVGLGGLLGSVDPEDIAGQSIVLLKPAGGDVYALAIDGVHDHEELVVKPAAPAVMAAGLYAGTTLADDGRPILLLDPSGIAAKAELRFGEIEAEVEVEEVVDDRAERAQLLVFRAMDGVRRAVRLPVVERIEEVPAAAVKVSAGRMRVALGGALLPLAGCAEPPQGKAMRLLRMTDGVADLAYAFVEVIDIMPLTGAVTPSDTAGEIEGVTLIDGEPVELIDAFWLFATAAAPKATDERPVCAMPAGDPWMENMLRPLVEGLGYRVVDSAVTTKADLVIASAGSDAPKADRVVRITASPEAAERGEAIYRYDRAAIVGALAVARGGA